MATIGDPVADLTAQMGKMQIAPWKENSLKKCSNVHRDDIHALLKAQNHFYSGSKDGTVLCWNFEGIRVKDITGFKPIDYRRWVTALASCGKDSFVVGYRDGLIELYNQNGDLTNEMEPRGNLRGNTDFQRQMGMCARTATRIGSHALPIIPIIWEKRAFLLDCPVPLSLWTTKQEIRLRAKKFTLTTGSTA